MTDYKPAPPLTLGPITLNNRLILGTGKYPDYDVMRAALEASGTEMVTVAVRRLDQPEGNLLEALGDKYILLPNTAGCFSAEDAVRTCRLAREMTGSALVKLEVLGDTKTLLPDPGATLEATKTLVAEGFTVLVYTSDDPIAALRLEQAGATAVMPAGSPIGSGQGVLNPNNLRLILELCSVPIIVDAGVGTASDVAIAMELGAAGVLLNTGVAHAADPVAMAHAMRHALEAGRLAAGAGRIPRRLYAKASSPTDGLIATGIPGE